MLVGGWVSWEGSAAGCCPVSHHVPPRRPTSSCGPGAQGRKLDTGPSTAGMLWERFVHVCVTVCICVEELWLTGGRLLSNVVGLSLNPPPHHHHHLTPHHLTHCALWPGMSSRSTLHKCTHNTYARTGTSTHMASIKKGCMAPCKKV